MQSLLDLCEGSERSPGARVGMRWWEKVVVKRVGSREAATAVAEKGVGED